MTRTGRVDERIKEGIVIQVKSPAILSLWREYSISDRVMGVSNFIVLPFPGGVKLF